MPVKWPNCTLYAPPPCQPASHHSQQNTDNTNKPRNARLHKRPAGPGSQVSPSEYNPVKLTSDSFPIISVIHPVKECRTRFSLSKGLPDGPNLRPHHPTGTHLRMLMGLPAGRSCLHLPGPLHCLWMCRQGRRVEGLRAPYQGPKEEQEP